MLFRLVCLVFPLVVICFGLNTVIILWPTWWYRDPSEGVLCLRFFTDSRVICLWYKHDPNSVQHNYCSNLLNSFCEVYSTYWDRMSKFNSCKQLARELIEVQLGLVERRTVHFARGTSFVYITYLLLSQTHLQWTFSCGLQRWMLVCLALSLYERKSTQHTDSD